MIRLKIFTLMLLLCQTLGGFGQIRTGFKTGLNFASMRGPIELGASGNNLESWKNNTGFHIGMTFSHKFSNLFGVRGEVLYTKKGGKYEYVGPSYKFFTSGSNKVFTTGDLSYKVQVTNAYIEVPILATLRYHSFELSAGVSAALLVQSNGNGSQIYTGKTTPLMNPTGTLEFNLDHNYRKDDPGQSTDKSPLILVQLDGQKVEVPQVIGAYYDYATRDGNLYNPLDFSAIVGVSYFLSHALYAGVRLHYGLTDITNNKVDILRSHTDANNAPVFSNDMDKNFLIQASVGFSF